MAYVRRPLNITTDSDGVRAAEYGEWTAIDEPPEKVRSGSYLASWQKFGDKWKIAFEAYASTDRAPQSITDRLRPTATLTVGGSPDWLAITPHAVWVSNAVFTAIQRIDVRTNTLTARVSLPSKPCSGLAYAFGSVWVPLCGRHPALARIDAVSNSITSILPIGPALSEGGIAAGNDSIWMVTDHGKLARIDPKTNRLRQAISIASGSYNPLFSEGTIWVTSGDKNLLTAVNAASGKIVATIPVGPKPRFLTAGDGMVWTLNQGDGSISKVDAKSRRLIANIEAEIPGAGGEITYGAGSVYATIVGVPLTQIDAKTNAVRGQWGGRGGDAVRFGHNSIWLTDYFRGLVWRIPPRSFGRRHASAFFRKPRIGKHRQ